MPGSLEFKLKCPTCGKHQGVSEFNTRTREEWFGCEACGWGHKTTLRRFGEQSLSRLTALLGTKSGQKPKPPKRVTLDHLLGEIAMDWGMNAEPLATVNSILKRPFAERTSSEWEFVEEFIKCDKRLLDLKARSDEGNG